MRIALFITLLASALRMMAAPGDVVSAHIETNGWVLHVEFQGMTNKGSFASGMDSYRGITLTNSIELLLSDPGFSSSGGAITRSRRVIATRQLRSPYPNISSNEFYTVGTNCFGRFSLSDWVYSQSEITSLSVRSGSYTDATRSNLPLFGVAWATNNSTNLYPKPVAQWVGLEGVPFRIGETANVAVVAFDHHSNDGTPVAAVKFWTVDGAGNVGATQTVSRPTRWVTPNGLNEVRYTASLPLSGLAVGLVTNHFEVLPSFGTNTLNTSDGQFSFPTYHHAGMPFFYTNLAQYGQTIAFVDPVSGVDSSGVATTNMVSITNTFKTIQAAKVGIMRTNWLLRGRADEGAGVIYLTNGTYNTSGTDVTSNVPPTYVTITSLPGLDRASINITNAAASIGKMVLVSNVTFNSIQASASVSGNCSFWVGFGNHFQTNTGTTFFGNVTNIYLVENTINQITGTLQAVGTANTNFRLVEGNDFSGYVGPVHHGCFVGNYRTGGTNGTLSMPWTDSVNHDPPSYPIIAFNHIGSLVQAGTHVVQITQPPSYMKLTNGFAFVGNLFEVVGDISGDNNNGRLLSISVSTSAADTNDVENGIICCNTLVGSRGPHGFDNASSAVGSGSAKRQLNVIFNNSADQINVKTDKDSTASGAHLGSLPVDHGVGWIGNTDLDPIWMDPAWGGEFRGIGSIARTNSSGRGLTAEWATFTQYQNRQTASGLTNIIDGGGNYRLKSSSPLFRLATRWYLPWDLDGVPTGRTDPPGAFTSGNAKKGAFF